MYDKCQCEKKYVCHIYWTYVYYRLLINRRILFLPLVGREADAGCGFQKEEGLGWFNSLNPASGSTTDDYLRQFLFKSGICYCSTRNNFRLDKCEVGVRFEKNYDD